ncbi:MAG: CmcI family methyltransferase [Nodosilinea sp.]
MNNPLWAQDSAEAMSLLQLWHQQVKQHHLETFRGVGLQKFPQDLWLYERLLWEVKPTVVFEVGVNQGGFSLWLAERLRSIQLHQLASANASQRPTPGVRVVGIDIDISNAQANLVHHADLASYICFEQVDAAHASALTEMAQRYVSSEDSVLVIEDSAHIYATTMASLVALAPLVSLNSYFIVEDGCVDFEHLRECEQWPRGVMQAVQDFLLTHPEFVQDSIGDCYTITCHPGGFLRRIV